MDLIEAFQPIEVDIKRSVAISKDGHLGIILNGGKGYYIQWRALPASRQFYFFKDLFTTMADLGIKFYTIK